MIMIYPKPHKLKISQQLYEISQRAILKCNMQQLCTSDNRCSLVYKNLGLCEGSSVGWQWEVISPNGS